MTPPTDLSSDSRWVDEPAQPAGQRWRTWLKRHHLATLLVLSLLGVVVALMWVRLLAVQPYIPGQWRLTDPAEAAAGPGGLRLNAPPRPPDALVGAIGDTLIGLSGPDGQRLGDAAHWRPRPDRWIVSDAERERHLAIQQALREALQAPAITLEFASGRQVQLAPPQRGLPGLGVTPWALTGLALALYLAVVVGVLARPGRGNVLYALIAAMQGLALALTAQDLMPGLGGPALPPHWSWALHVTADVVSAAALVHLVLRVPRLFARARWGALGAWLAAVAVLALCLQPGATGVWWWINGAMLCAGAIGLLLLRWAQRRSRHPVASVMLWLLAAGAGTLVLLVFAQAAAGPAVPGGSGWPGYVPALWTVFVASLLMLGPFLSRARQVLREFALLAGFGTAAMSLHLITSALMPESPTVAWAITLALAVLVYALARPVLAGGLAGSSRISAEHLFDGLYRTARGFEQNPKQAAVYLARLMREVFDPISIQRKARELDHVRLAADGTALAVPVPGSDQLAGGPAQPGTLLLRHARQGRRLFTEEDRHLTERMLEQLRKAADHDRAVELGRAEERQRIAQDLHDDIGARLLTLMYKAPNSEIEEYIRHTLQDLKTLTRGLAAANPRLSHAAAEWKADIAQRLNPTGCDLRWSFAAERDIKLNVVQWSGLTRVLRELINNVISHAQATQAEVTLAFDGQHLQLSITDDGCGRNPARWSHGLGLGGVRKRVKQLGGVVRWLEAEPTGIRCEVEVPLRSASDRPGQDAPAGAADGDSALDTAPPEPTRPMTLTRGPGQAGAAQAGSSARSTHAPHPTDAAAAPEARRRSTGLRWRSTRSGPSVD